VLGARERVFRVQARAGLGFLEVLADHVAFEQNGFLAARLRHAKKRHLAERRDLEEPVRLLREVDHDAFEGHVLFEECDRGALDVGAQQVADEGELGGHACFRVVQVNRKRDSCEAQRPFLKKPMRVIPQRCRSSASAVRCA
jgi:hypothetical protein